MENGQGPPENRAAKKKKGFAIFGVIVLAGLTVLFFFRGYSKTHIKTDDAFVEGAIHIISSRVPGTISSNLTVILMIVLATAITTSSLIIARSISKPLDELTKGTRIISRGDLEHRVKVKSKDELGEFAVAFNQMTEELSQDITERRRAEFNLEERLKELA